MFTGCCVFDANIKYIRFNSIGNKYQLHSHKLSLKFPNLSVSLWFNSQATNIKPKTGISTVNNDNISCEFESTDFKIIMREKKL